MDKLVTWINDQLGFCYDDLYTYLEDEAFIAGKIDAYNEVLKFLQRKGIENGEG